MALGLFLVLGCSNSGGGAAGEGGDEGAVAVSHAITLVNNCEEPIWIASNAESPSSPQDWALGPRCSGNGICAEGQTCRDSACTCATDEDCTFGSSASTTSKCDLTTGTCTTTASVAVDAGWSGRFWARTRCSGTDQAFVCKTGQCGPASGGAIDCAASASTANLATLFELFASGLAGIDNFDVSLVSGYNVPVVVTPVLPPEHAQWMPDTTFDAGAQIVESVGDNTFGYTQSSATGVSGATEPMFSGTWTDTVMDSAISWVNVGPQCQKSGCTSDLNTTCPTALQVDDGGDVIACDAPANACVPTMAACNDNLDYYQCQNNGGAQDLFGDVIDLQSPNAETYVCFSADDCPGGTTCTLNPSFDSGFTLPTGTGLCLPVTQNGGCTPADDGKPCPLRTYPFVEYQCETLSGGAADSQVCIPPTTTGLGTLWWNAANWSKAPGDTICMEDGDCMGPNDKCLAEPTLGGAKQCPEDDLTCACYAPNPCNAARGANDGCPAPRQCLDSEGAVDGAGADCSTETCYCGPQGIFSGACGPTNADWNSAATAVGDWPTVFKSACPVAYAYQYDDPSSNWSCRNPTDGDALIGYRVDFCLP